MFKKSLLLCGLIFSFCLLQAKGIDDQKYLLFQKGAIASVDLLVEQFENELPGNDLESLNKRRKALEVFRDMYVLAQSKLELFRDANIAAVTSSAAAVALAASYIKRSRALRIGGFVTPLVAAYSVYCAKNGYYLSQALREELEARIKEIDRQIEWNKKNS